MAGIVRRQAGCARYVCIIVKQGAASCCLLMVIVACYADYRSSGPKAVDAAVADQGAFLASLREEDGYGC